MHDRRRAAHCRWRGRQLGRCGQRCAVNGPGSGVAYQAPYSHRRGCAGALRAGGASTGSGAGRWHGFLAVRLAGRLRRHRGGVPRVPSVGAVAADALGCRRPWLASSERRCGRRQRWTVARRVRGFANAGGRTVAPNISCAGAESGGARRAHAAPQGQRVAGPRLQRRGRWRRAPGAGGYNVGDGGAHRVRLLRLQPLCARAGRRLRAVAASGPRRCRRLLRLLRRRPRRG